MQEYLAGKADLTAKPEEVNRSNILAHVCMGVNFMHERHLVHGAITTDHIMWFPEENRWKLMGFTNWARSGENMRLDYDLRYAAPELLLADLARVFPTPNTHPPATTTTPQITGGGTVQKFATAGSFVMR